ncbi:MAG: DUF349 domain-containing protein [Bacteroidales bacterium]|nr:DUF349 domain-containing protein [Bacteroidales bacterium]
MEEPTLMPTPENDVLQPAAQEVAANQEITETNEIEVDAKATEASELVPQANPIPASDASCKDSSEAENTIEVSDSVNPQTESSVSDIVKESVDAECTEGAEPTTDASEAQEHGAIQDELEGQEQEINVSGLDRQQLYEAFQSLMEKEVQNIRHSVAGIRNRFFELTKEVEKSAYEAYLAAGGVKEEYQPVIDDLTERFRKLHEAYKERRQKYLDDIEAAKQRNYEAKQQTLDELRQLIDSDEETLKQTYDRFNAIQEKWKTIGEVPREHLNDLWQNYHFLVEKFFNKVNITKELRLLDLKHNLEQKIQLCEKAEELIVEESIVKAFKGLNHLRDRWREIGPVPAEQNDEIWQRFCNAANQIDERRKEYYDQRKEELDKNLLAKQALVDKARELTTEMPKSASQWNSVTSELDEMLKLWKSIGPVPREANEEVWHQFKGMLDQFYAAKKSHFSEVRDEQTENYNRKIDLCLKAEAIAKRDDWKRATDEILQLQSEWKSIGPVSRKVSDKIWHRFRGACDEFFARKGEHFKNLRSSEGDNLAKKQALIEQLKNYQFGDDKEENLSVIKDFQRQWMEIGHVPMSEKDRIQQDFRNTINAHFEKLKISAREAAESAYRERVQSNTGDRRFISSERQSLQEKIDKLRGSIQLWENNLGFLASSRSADLLKEEFEKKMQSTRQQIALLEAKLKILIQSEREEKKEE